MDVYLIPVATDRYEIPVQIEPPSLVTPLNDEQRSHDTRDSRETVEASYWCVYP